MARTKNYKSISRIYEAWYIVAVSLFVFVGLLSLWPAPTNAAVAKFINFQGKLTKTSDGTNVANGNYSMQFKLYDALTSGTLLWTETWDGGTSQVAVTNGVFNVRLGTYTSLDTVDFSSANIFLSVNFNPGAGYDGEMSPRKQLVSAPYALNANNLVGDGRLSLDYAPATSTYSAARVNFVPSVSSTQNVLNLIGGANVSGASIAVSTAGTGNAIDLAGGGTNARTINSTGAALVLKTTTSGNITLSPASGIVTGSGALTLQSGGATVMAVDAGGAAALQLGTTNANAVTISRSGVATTIQGTATFNEAVTVGNGAGNDYLAFAAESSNPTCSAGQYRVWANSTDLKLKKCQNGTVSDLDTTGGGGSPIFSAILAADNTNSIDNTNFAQTWQWSTLTTQTGLTLSGGSAMTSGTVLQVGEATFVHTASNDVGRVLQLTFTDASTNTNNGGVTSGLDIAATINTSGAGTKEINGLRIATPTLTACATGACTFNGLKFSGGTGTLANLTSYGLQIEAGSGSGIEYAAVFTGGNVGIGTLAPVDMLQVGEAGNRGDLSVYGDITSAGFRSLKALANINDIFIYDTSADSDGGRWINWPTTRSLSWYTEPRDDGPDDVCNIATDDRCDAAAFPKKAILATTDDALYIFDATSDVLWMKFTQSGGTFALGADTNNNPSGVSALNGVVYVGTNGSSGSGVYAIDFINDMMYNFDATDRSQGDKSIVDRNTAVTYNINNVTTLAVASSRVNDVSAAVMTGSTNTNPVNGITLVAAGTDLGISIINLSAQRTFNYADNASDQYGAVYLTRRGFVYGMNVTRGQVERWINIDVDQASEFPGTPDRVWDETTTPALSKTAPTLTTGPDTLDVIERGSLALDVADIIYAGHSLGLTEIHDNTTAVNSAWSKFYTTTGQTSFMPATIRAAFMMNETSGDLTDSSFRNNVFQSFGTPTYGVDGVRGTAITFDGTSAKFCSDANNDNTCDNDADFNSTTTGFTIQLWFKKSGTVTGTDFMVNKCYTAVPAQAACTAIWMNSTGTVAFGIDDDATWTTTPGDDVATSTQTYNDGQWHHLVATRTNAAGAITLFIDGKQVATDGTLAATATLDGTQIMAIGGDCSVGVNCSSGANFWEGQLDDVTFSMGGATTTDQVTQIQARRLYNDARPTLADRSISVSNGDIGSSATIGATGQTWRTNEFIGQIVRINGGTGVGQSRRVVSNTATTLTVTPAWSTAPDSTSDFDITPSALMGTTNVVRAVGVTGRSPLGEARLLCVGTNDGADGGAVTCYNHNSGPNIVAEVYHSDAAKTDDTGTAWSGTDYDDIRAIDLKSTVEVFGSQAALWTESEDRRLGLSFDRVANLLFDVRAELITDGITGTGLEVGLTGAADLAEYYYSATPLEAGSVVMVDSALPGPNVKLTEQAYQRGVVGVVSTEPALVIGEKTDQGYPIALSGRIPVKVSLENGPIFPGDVLTTSSRSGYAMKALSAGPVLGTALTGTGPIADLGLCPDEPEDGVKCGYVTLFITVGQGLGQPVEQLVAQYELSLAPAVTVAADDAALVTEQAGDAATGLATTDALPDRILRFLQHWQQTQTAQGFGVRSEVFTDRVAAAFEVITPSVITQGLQTERIGSDGRALGLYGDIVFFGRPYLNKDSAGFATIVAGSQMVEVKFTEPYREQPVVTATLTGELDVAVTDPEALQRLLDQQNQWAASVFEKNVRWVIVNKSTAGFTLLLSEALPVDVTFSWTAFAVEKPTVFTSSESTLGDVLPATEPEVPTVTESPSVDSEPVPVVEAPNEPLPDVVVEE